MDKQPTKACAGIALAALAGQFLLGCDSAGRSRSSSPAKSRGASASVPFPVAVGDTWTYTLEIAGLPPSVLVKKITPSRPGSTPEFRLPRSPSGRGHSVDVLLRVYAKCIAGQHGQATRRIGQAMRHHGGEVQQMRPG
jgi:hypothetical protein